MRKILVGQGSNISIATASTFITGGRGMLANSATESVVQSPTYVAGTYSGMWIGVRSNTATGNTVLRNRINGVNGSMIITIPPATSGFFQDTTGSNSIASGDLVCFSATRGGSGTVVVDTVGVYMEEDVGVEYYQASGGTDTTTATATTNSFGQGQLTATNVNQRPTVVSPGEMRNLSINVTTNTRTTDTTLTLTVNGSPASLAITIAASSSGTFQNVSDGVKMQEGDLFLYTRTTTSGSGTFAFNRISSELRLLREELGTISAGRTLTAMGTNNAVYTISGAYQNGTSTTESSVAIPVPEAMTVGEIRIRLSANTIAGASTGTVTVRKNSADTAVSVTVPGATTGLFQNLTDWVSFSAGDTINYRFTRTGAGGNMDPRQMQVSVIYDNVPPYTSVTMVD